MCQVYWLPDQLRLLYYQLTILQGKQCIHHLLYQFVKLWLFRLQDKASPDSLWLQLAMD